MRPDRPLALALLLCSLMTGHCRAQGKTDARAKFIGMWQLVSRVMTRGDQVVHDPEFGDHPSGLLVYEQTGHMSVQIMTGERPGSPGVTADAAPPAPPRSADYGYTAYFGTFTVNEASKTVVHHAEGALLPGDVGRDMMREYTFEGNDLVLKIRGPGLERPALTLRWRRVGAVRTEP